MIIFLKTFSAGYQFSQTWPKREPYLLAFPQTKAIKLADVSLTAAPIIAFITAYMQLQYLGFEALNSALGMALLILSLPFHGYVLLGKQAESRLPVGLQSWYREIEHKLQQGALEFNRNTAKLDAKQKANSKLTYMDLAILLKELFESDRK